MSDREWLIPSASLTARFLPYAFGFAPVFLLLITWSGHQQNWWVKTYALPVLAVEMATVVVAFREGMRVRMNAVTACLAALLAIAWVTAFVAPSPSVAVVRTAIWTLHLFFGYAAARMFRANDLTEGLVAGFVVFVGLLAVFVATAPADFNWVYHMPGLGNVRRFGYYGAAVIGLCLGASACRNRWAFAVSSIGFALAFWSGSRGAFASAAIGLIAGLLIVPPLRNTRIWGAFIASAIVGAVVARVIGSPAALYGVTRMSDTGDNGRYEVWRAAINLITDRPWFGYGEGQMDGLARIPHIMHPHNIALQVLLAWGLFGSLLIFCLACLTARRTYQRYDVQKLPLIGAAIVLVAYSTIDGALYNVHPVAIFAACIGVAVGRRNSLPPNYAPLEGADHAVNPRGAV